MSILKRTEIHIIKRKSRAYSRWRYISLKRGFQRIAHNLTYQCITFHLLQRFFFFSSSSLFADLTKVFVTFDLILSWFDNCGFLIRFDWIASIAIPTNYQKTQYLSSNMSTIPTAAARKVLQNRALQCSFTSVFHIKKTANSVEALKEAKRVEDIWLKAVGYPMFAMGFIGAGALLWKWRKEVLFFCIIFYARNTWLYIM